MADTVIEDFQAEPENPMPNQIADLLEGAAEIVVVYRCKYHPNLAATSVCEACGADVCSDCSHVRGHGLICAGCMSGLDKAFAGIGLVSRFTRLLTHPIVIVLVIAGLLGIISFRFGASHRMGLLGRNTGNFAEAERNFQLKVLLFARKARRIETHGDSLYKMARYEKAAVEFRRAGATYESMIDITHDRWEQALLVLARARLLQKLGEDAYAKGLYENISTLTAPGKTYPAIARFHLGKLQEKDEPEKALKTYRKVVDDIMAIPDHIISAIHLTAGSDAPYDYETRLHTFTGTDVNFDDLEAGAHMRMGLLLAGLGREEDAAYRFGRAAESAADPELGKWAAVEARQLRASRRAEGSGTEPSLKQEKPEKFVITHF